MLNLGIIVNENGEIINHRSLLKVLFNPVLRVFGFQIATILNEEKNSLENAVFNKCSRMKINDSIKSWSYKPKDNEFIIKQRLFV